MKLENIENNLARAAASAMGKKGGLKGGLSTSAAKRRAAKINLLRANKALKEWRKNNCK